jgi:hypothetical protein
MTVLLHCTRCGGNIRPFKYTGCRVCDVDGESLTPEYRRLIQENGCAFFTLRSIPRRDSKFGNHPFGVVDTAEQVATHIPRDVLNNFKNHDDGNPYVYEYESMVIS